MIQVNGYTINPVTVGMLDRRPRRYFSDALGEMTQEEGVYVRFIGGAVKWIADPEAREVEAQFLRYDGVQETPELW
jgi:hypothetical protein